MAYIALVLLTGIIGISTTGAQATRALTTMPVPSASYEVPLGSGTVSVEVPRGFFVDIEPYLPLRELVWYRLTDPSRRYYHYSLIAVTSSDMNILNSGLKEQICVNGLQGLKYTQGGDIAVVLRLPEESGMYHVLFDFKNDDRVAWAILRSIKVLGHRRHCP
jgi:hypothetical protein